MTKYGPKRIPAIENKKQKPVSERKEVLPTLIIAGLLEYIKSEPHLAGQTPHLVGEGRQ